MFTAGTLNTKTLSFLPRLIAKGVEEVLVVLRDFIRVFEITQKEDFLKFSLWDIFCSSFLFSFFFGLCGGSQSCFAQVELCGILQCHRMKPD